MFALLLGWRVQVLRQGQSRILLQRKTQSQQQVQHKECQDQGRGRGEKESQSQYKQMAGGHKGKHNKGAEHLLQLCMRKEAVFPIWNRVIVFAKLHIDWCV